MLLSDFFQKENIFQDIEFQDLGYSQHHGTKILTFCDNIHYLEKSLSNTNVVAIIIKKEMLKNIKEILIGIIIHDKPRDIFFELYNHMRDNNLFIKNLKYSIDKSAKISNSAIVSKKCSIGKNCVISENVIIKDDVFIADNCFIDCGVIIGNEGILYNYDENGDTKFIKHAGIVTIGQNVTLLANSVIVKSVFSNMPTNISNNSIIGISTTIGHEANLAHNTKILGNCVIAKNVQIGANTIVGSSSVIRENTIIGSGVDIKAGSIVVKNVDNDFCVSGNFALDHRLNIKDYFKKKRG